MKKTILDSLLPILCPVFYSSFDKENNEFIFLDCGERIDSIQNREMDKVSCEAIFNHIHYDFKSYSYCAIKKVMDKIANNLKINLKYNYPNKNFYIYYEIKKNREVIIRFHQDWKDELPYYPSETFPSLYTIYC
mgnify:CR=1 FL=1